MAPPAEQEPPMAHGLATPVYGENRVLNNVRDGALDARDLRGPKIECTAGTVPMGVGDAS